MQQPTEETGDRWRPEGHPMLGVRGTVALLQCATTLILVFSGINWS